MWRLCRVGNQKKENYHNFVEPVLCIVLQVYILSIYIFWSLRRLLSPNQLMPSLKQFCAIDGTPPPLHHQFSRQATKTSKLWAIYQALSTPISWKFEIRFYWNHFNEMILVLHMIGSVLPFLSSEIPSIPIYLYSIFWRVWISRTNGQKHQ